MGSVCILVPKGMKGKGKHSCLSYVLEQEFGQQRTDVVIYMFLAFNLVLINRWHRVRKFPKVAVLSLPESMKSSILCPFGGP